MKNSAITKFQFSSSDYDEFGSLLEIAHLDQKILESGAFIGNAHFIRTKHVTLLDFYTNRKVLQQGTAAPGYLIFTIWEPNTLFTWRNIEMKTGMIGIVWNREHQSVSGSNFRGIPISIEENYFMKLCIEKGFSELVNILKKKEVLHVPETQLKEIRNLIYFIFLHNSFDDNSLEQRIEQELMDLLIRCMGSSLQNKSRIGHTRIKMNLVMDYIHDNLSSLTSLHQVVDGTNIPERTLRRLITSKYQISPKQFLNRLRLNEVRKALILDKNNSNIYQIANDYNFWHRGQFSKDYKRLFRELPSDTLSKLISS